MRAQLMYHVVADTWVCALAQRMTAPPGHSERSRLSVMCQTYCNLHHPLKIKRSVFMPEPEVCNHALV